jgi:hypothetical protein
MAANTCEIRVGRLLQIRVAKGYETPEDVDEMIAMIRAATAKLTPDVKHVTVADWRHCSVMSAEASEQALKMLLTTNPRTERSATIYSASSPTAVMQFVRLVREAGNPNRRLFSEVTSLTTWLDELLTPEESAELHRFLAT